MPVNLSYGVKILLAKSEDSQVVQVAGFRIKSYRITDSSAKPI